MTTYKVINALLKNKDGEWISPHTADTLKKNQITNCITEIPQRIKYTLENGTLTIKAGSVVIVPYGTTDRTSEFPVGATFLNDNFKVYDTQYSDGKFFVWAEVINDFSKSTDVTDTNKRPVLIDVKNNTITALLYHYSGSSGFSGTGNALYYHTDTNIVDLFYSGVIQDAVMSLPVAIVTSDGTNIYGSVSQVFNGFGYIGQCTFVDKGVKALFADGRNEDGTLKNVEITSTKVSVTNIQGQTSILSRFDGNTLWGYGVNAYYIQDTKPTITGDHAMWFSPLENYLYITTDGGATWGKNLGIVGKLTKTDANGSITGMLTFRPFKAVDYNDAILKTTDATLTMTGMSDGNCQQRFVRGGYGLMFRQDGSNFYMLLTNKGNEYGGWNDLRPFTMNLATGAVKAALSYNITTWYDVGSGWVAPTNGLVYVQGYSNSKGASGQAHIDGHTIYYNAQSGSNANHHVIAIAVPIYKGQTLTHSGLEAARFCQYV